MEGKNKRKSAMKTFAISGWVQVEVYAYVKAKSLSAVKRAIKKACSLNSAFEFNEGNWVSDITLDTDPMEVDPREASGFVVTEITEKAKMNGEES